jgi:hypothetical protein
MGNHVPMHAIAANSTGRRAGVRQIKGSAVIDASAAHNVKL